jgi:hypothetical protein
MSPDKPDVARIPEDAAAAAAAADDDDEDEDEDGKDDVHNEGGKFERLLSGSKLEGCFSSASDSSVLCRSWERRNQLSSESNCGRSSKTPERSASSDMILLGDKLIFSMDPD